MLRGTQKDFYDFSETSPWMGLRRRYNRLKNELIVPWRSSVSVTNDLGRVGRVVRAPRTAESKGQ